MYSSSFGTTLIALTMITTVVILAVTSNVVLSLGMVGALSIVRFCTAFKAPLDIAFLFWAIAVGIVLAAGMIPLAVIGSVAIGVILFVNTKYDFDLIFFRTMKLPREVFMEMRRNLTSHRAGIQRASDRTECAAAGCRFLGLIQSVT